MISDSDHSSGQVLPITSTEQEIQGLHDARPPSFYVGIGASAGGLEAIEAFFKHMPPTSGLAFIVIQHLSPDYKSLMVELLSKRTEMKVLRAENGMQVSANVVYLIPPKKHLTIFHGRLMLGDPERSRSGIFLPIDTFLRSLADDQGEKAIGVILSGTGSDGMRGVRAIKESGGMVMVQDESSAKFDGMPRSAISTGLVDFILPPEEMSAQMLAFADHPEQMRSVRSETLLTDEDGLTRIFALLRDRHKVDFTYYKPSTVVRRIERRMTVNHIHTLRDYVKFLESYPRELSVLYKELLIGVTNFFRDPEAFRLLADEHLPALLARVKGPLVRFWVTGCSTGEEAYTLAILCRETLEKLGRSLDIKIFATDVDHESVLLAGNGIYPESIAADVSPNFLSKYFVRRGDAFQVARGIREMVVFAQHNLIRDPPFTNIEFIACRNLLIYLQPVLQRKVLAYFNFSLNQDGLLFLGHSETVGEMMEEFEPLSHKWKIYRSKGNRKKGIAEMEVSKLRSNGGRLLRPSFLGPQKAMRLHEEERILDRLLETLAGDYLPLAMVVNEQMELIHVLGDTSGVLRYPSGRVVNDIARLAVNDLSVPLSTGLQKALKRKEEVRYTHVRLRRPGLVRTIDLRIKPLLQKKGQEPMAVILIEEPDRAAAKPMGPEASIYDLDGEAVQRIEDLEQELQFTRENLQATIEELETSNEELQATNEELLASNEELQSTNEELQSVNEELHTVNTEHQRKIIELTELNNDIRNLMESSGVGTLFLDENMEVRRFTPQTSKIYQITEKDVGRPLHQIPHGLEDVDPVALVQKVHADHDPIEKEVRTRAGHHYLMRILPYTVGAAYVSGSVMAFIDIDSQVRSRNALEESETKLRLLADKLEDVFWIRATDNGRVVYISPAYETIWGKDIQALCRDARSFLDSVHPADRDVVADQLSRHTQGQWNLEYRITDKTGAVRWIHDRGFPVFDSEGRLELMCGFATDITERKHKEESCLLSVSKFKPSFEGTSIGIALVNIKGRFLESNPAFKRILSASEAALEDMTLVQCIHPGDRPAGEAMLTEMAAGRRDFYHAPMRLQGGNNRTLAVQLVVTLIRDGQGQPTHALCQIFEAADDAPA